MKRAKVKRGKGKAKPTPAGKHHARSSRATTRRKTKAAPASVTAPLAGAQPAANSAVTAAASLETPDIGTERGAEPLANPHHELFCREYLVDLKGAAAWRRIGGAELSARQQATRLMSRDDIQARIAYLWDQRAMRTDVRADDVLKTLDNIRSTKASDIFDFTTNPPTLKAPHLWPEWAVDSIRNIKVRREVTREDGKEESTVWQVMEISLLDKLGAIQNQMRHLGLYAAEERVNFNRRKGRPMTHDERIARVRSLLHGARERAPTTRRTG